MAFTQKLLQANISLATGSFGGGGNSISVTATETGSVAAQNALATILRMSAHIEVMGSGPSSGTMLLAIYGLPLQLMNQLSTVGTQITLIDKNSISLLAGDAESGMSLVFSGIIHNAYVDANNQPQVCFRISAVPGGGSYAAQQVPPISLQGSQDVAQMLSKLAGQMGLQFENNNVNVKLTNPYYGGSPWEQAIEIAKHANIEMVVDRGTMAILPTTGSRSTGGTTLISAATGMVGYPAFRESVIIVRSLFNPAVVVDGDIQVQSDLTPANGTWKVYKITYDLECAMPHGRWFQTMEGTITGTQYPP